MRDAFDARHWRRASLACFDVMWITPSKYTVRGRTPARWIESEMVCRSKLSSGGLGILISVQSDGVFVAICLQ